MLIQDHTVIRPTRVPKNMLQVRTEVIEDLTSDNTIVLFVLKFRRQIGQWRIFNDLIYLKSFFVYQSLITFHDAVYIYFHTGIKN